MAKLQFTCADCQRELKADEERAGREIRCPHCQHVMVVPEQTDASAGSGGEPTTGDNERASGTSSSSSFAGPAESDEAGSSGDTGRSSGSTFSVTNVIKTSFRMFFEDVSRFLTMGLIVFSPLLVMVLVLLVAAGDKKTVLMFWEVANGVSILLLIPLLSGAMMFGVIRRLRGEAFRISECLSEALGMLGPLIGLALLQGVIVGLGTLLLVLPGVIAFTMLFVSTPALVIERCGVVDAIKRSYHLTWGKLLRIYGIIVLFGSINLVLMLMVVSATIGLNGFRIQPAMLTATLSEIKNFMVMSSLVSVLTNTLVSIAIGTTYYFLRVDEEDTTLDEMVHLFD